MAPAKILWRVILTLGCMWGSMGRLASPNPALAQGTVSRFNTNQIILVDEGTRLIVLEYNRQGPPYRFEIVDASTLVLLDTVELDLEGEIIDVSANGEWVVYEQQAGGYAIHNWITGEDTAIAPGGPVPIPVASIAWNPVDGRIVHGEGTVGIISAAIFGPEVPGGAIINDSNPGISSASWSSDGTRLATTGASHIAIWDPEQVTAALASQPALEFPGTGTELTWDPTDRYLAGHTRNCAIIVYSVVDGSVVQELQCPANTALFSIAWSPDGTQLAASHTTGIYIWDVATSELVDSYSTSRPVGSLVWLPIGLVHDGDQPGLYRDAFPVSAPLSFDPPNTPAEPSPRAAWTP